MSSEGRERLERVLGGAALAKLRARLRARIARGGTSDAITFSRLSPHERDTLTGLIGRRAREAGSLRVKWAELDDALARAELAPSLRAALELLDGPIPDLLAERALREQTWAQALAAASGDVHLAALCASARGRGLLKRLALGQPATADRLLRSAAHVLGRLPAAGIPRSQLAAETLGDAHALDTQRPLATLILIALRSDDDERPRDIWARSGVLVNELAKPALSLNLPAATNTATGALARAGCDHGEPVSLTLRALLRSQPRWLVQDREVFVCENPNLLAIAADRLGDRCAPLVCTDGMPSASQRTLLRQLAAAGARLRYHGDFDWPGLRIGNFVVRSFGATPWRFDTEHYRPPADGRSLLGAPVSALWDERLMPAMLARNIALDEEAVALSLLSDLSA